MKSRFWRLLFPVSVLCFCSCSFQHYQAAPLVPVQTASSFESRNLADAGLRAFMEQNLGRPSAPWPPKLWNLQTLSLAALYFNPDMQAARARLEEAQAAAVTAGQRPNPTLDFSPGIPSPYLLTLDLLPPIETAGKRGYRIDSARNLEQAARLDEADSAWKIHSAVRKALLDYFLDSRSRELLANEERFRGEQVSMLQRRFAAGEIPRPEVDLARIELSKVHLLINTVQGEVAKAKAEIAASLGVPLSALDDDDFEWTGIDSPPAAESLSAPQIQREAVLNRLDIRGALAQYGAAEKNLQLEVAKQYPDVQIGPGYTYEEANSFFTVGLSLALPLFNRNQGPIAEAEARRKEAAAAFLQKQAQAIADSDRALAAYSAARSELTEADQSLRALQENQLRTTERAVGAGEDDRLTLNGVQLESSAVAQARLDALGRAQAALGDLEDALQRPLTTNDEFPLNSASTTVSAFRKEPAR